jgi:hypothetical protein
MAKPDPDPRAWDCRRFIASLGATAPSIVDAEPERRAEPQPGGEPDNGGRRPRTASVPTRDRARTNRATDAGAAPMPVCP